MAQSLSKILLHLVFSTKDRMDIIPTDISENLYSYLAGVGRTHGVEVFRVGGTANHAHIACTLSRTSTVSDLVEAFKKSSSIWIKQQDTRCANFSWQAGYGAFSLGQSQLDAIVGYIEK